jgi:hypothetical protein
MRFPVSVLQRRRVASIFAIDSSSPGCHEFAKFDLHALEGFSHALHRQPGIVPVKRGELERFLISGWVS